MESSISTVHGRSRVLPAEICNFQHTNRAWQGSCFMHACSYVASPQARSLSLHYFWSLDSFFVLAATTAGVRGPFRCACRASALARAYLPLSLSPNIILLPPNAAAAVPSDLNLARAAVRCVAGEGEERERGRRGDVAREERRGETDRQRAPRFPSLLPPSLSALRGESCQEVGRRRRQTVRPSVRSTDRPADRRRSIL